MTLIDSSPAHDALFDKVKRFLRRTGILLLTSSLIVLTAEALLASESGEQGYDPGDENSIAGFRISPYLDEQELTLLFPPGVRVHINAPSKSAFDPAKRVGIVLYALPNGNTIEQTAGKAMMLGDDWHFDIQHIAAQTRFLRKHSNEYNLVVAYLETAQKSWPAWKKRYSDSPRLITGLVDSLKQVFQEYDPFFVLSGHSGGGSFIFGYLSAASSNVTNSNALGSIPEEIERISFLDSNYGYETEYGEQIAEWLAASEEHFLSVIAYNDSVALYKGKPFVSATGGTWYRSKMMLRDLSRHFPFKHESSENFHRHEALDGRVEIILIENPERKIFHTVLVERNGFIQAILSGTELEAASYDFWGRRAYIDWILGEMPAMRSLTIPSRSPDAITGSAFMDQMRDLPFDRREERIYQEISQGNIPNFLRQPVTLQSAFEDARGASRTVEYQVLPDYLAVGSDQDFCRIPMGPKTAQAIADLIGASLPTGKMVDDIYHQAEVKVEPVTYYPVGNANEEVGQFVRHNEDVEEQRKDQDAELGQLLAGLKKDVVISNKFSDPDRTHHVVIYGWHTLDGDPIQPLTNVHIDNYVDYSHGVRLINSELMIDGAPMEIEDVLGDSVLYRLISDEDGVMARTRY